MTHRTVPLGDVVLLQAGVGFPVDLQGRRSGTYPLAKVGDISRAGRSASSVIDTADHYVDDADLVRLRMNPVPAGSVLFAKIGEAIRQNHRVVAGRPMLIDNNAMAAVPGPNVESRYLYHYLRCVDFYRLASATTVPALRKSDLERMMVPLPPIVEQRRIADILDRADALRAKRRKALAHLDDLTQSIFLDMFGEPTRNDRGWPRAEVRDFVAGFESGKNLVAEDSDDVLATHRVLKVSAVTSGRFRPHESKALPADYVPPAHHLVRDGDLLFSRANTTELIGATALVNAPPPNLALPDKLWRFVWHAEPRAEPVWAWHLFKRPAFRREIGRRATGTSGSMQNISQHKVLSIPLGLPPLIVQRRFATRVGAIETFAQASRVAIQSLDDLFASLQQRAFAGEL